MKHKKLQLSILLAYALSLTGVYAQKTLSASGGSATGSGGSVCFTVGQVDYFELSGTNGYVTQGVQQPFEIFKVTRLKEVAGTVLKYSVYPNPLTQNLILKTEGELKKGCVVSLYDIHGKLLEIKNIENQETILDMQKYATAAYFLKITSGNKEIQTFKIIKN